MRHDYTNKHWQLDMEGPKKPWIKWIRIAIIVIILLILVSFLTHCQPKSSTTGTQTTQNTTPQYKVIPLTLPQTTAKAGS